MQQIGLDVIAWIQAPNSIWKYCNEASKQDLLHFARDPNWVSANTLILMAMSREDKFIQKTVEDKVQSQMDIQAQAVKLAALRAHIDACTTNLIPTFRKQPQLLLYLLEEVIRMDSRMKPLILLPIFPLSSRQLPLMPLSSPSPP